MAMSACAAPKVETRGKHLAQQPVPALQTHLTPAQTPKQAVIPVAANQTGTVPVAGKRGGQNTGQYPQIFAPVPTTPVDALSSEEQAALLKQLRDAAANHAANAKAAISKR